MGKIENVDTNMVSVEGCIIFKWRCIQASMIGTCWVEEDR